MENIWESSPAIHYVKFESEMLDDFFYWKRVIEDYESYIANSKINSTNIITSTNQNVTRSKLSDFIKRLSFDSTIYYDHVSGKQVSFSIIKAGTQTIVFYMMNWPDDDLFDKFYKALSSIGHDVTKLQPLDNKSIYSDIDRDIIYKNGKIVWMM